MVRRGWVKGSMMIEYEVRGINGDPDVLKIQLRLDRIEMKDDEVGRIRGKEAEDIEGFVDSVASMLTDV
jgi:hypothetical protein